MALFCQLFVLITHAVNIPWADEWGGASFYPGMQTRKFNPDFMLAFHNEHRIVWTKLSFWLAYKLSNLNLVSLILFNYILYAALVICFVKKLEKETNLPLSFSIILLASTLPIENHHMAFQNQFHFAIIFFLCGVFTLFSNKPVKWLSPLLVGGSMFAMGSGVALSFGYILACMLLCMLKLIPRNFAIYCVSIYSLLIIIWFQGFPSTPHHQGFNLTPFSFDFWKFLFNLVGLGFGFRELSIIPGILWALAIIYLIYSHYQSLSDKKSFLKSTTGSLLAICAGIASFVLIISNSRGGAGEQFSKASRYSEVMLLLIPITLVFFEYYLSRLNHGLNKSLTRVMVYLIIFVPFADKFHYNTEYKAAYKPHKEARLCIDQYYRGEGDGICHIPIKADLKAHLDFARKLKLTFVN